MVEAPFADERCLGFIKLILRPKGTAKDIYRTKSRRSLC